MTREQAKQILAGTTPFKRVGRLIAVQEMSVINELIQGKSDEKPHAPQASVFLGAKVLSNRVN